MGFEVFVLMDRNFALCRTKMSHSLRVNCCLSSWVDVRSKSSFLMVFGHTCLGVSESIESIALKGLDSIEGMETIDTRFFDFLWEEAGDVARDLEREYWGLEGSSSCGEPKIGPSTDEGSTSGRRGSSKYPVPSQSQLPLMISTVGGPSPSSSGQLLFSVLSAILTPVRHAGAEFSQSLARNRRSRSYSETSYMNPNRSVSGCWFLSS